MKAPMGWEPEDTGRCTRTCLISLSRTRCSARIFACHARIFSSGVGPYRNRFIVCMMAVCPEMVQEGLARWNGEKQSVVEVHEGLDRPALRQGHIHRRSAVTRTPQSLGTARMCDTWSSERGRTLLSYTYIFATTLSTLVVGYYSATKSATLV